MDWNDYRRRFEEEAARQGKSPEFVRKKLAYAEPLARADLPIIYDIAHLSALLGFEEAAVRAAIQSPGSLYTRYAIPKRTVGYRLISEPVDSLRQIQRWILEQILNKRRPHDAAQAFCKDRSIKHNASLHVGQRLVLSLDVKDFFPSVHVDAVRRVFHRMGYSDEVSDALTRLCVLRDGLPQGAPTSPAISNLVMLGVDQELSEYARLRGINYSRYADDLTFSGDFWAGSVIGKVRHALKRRSFVLNEQKTRLMQRHRRQEVTGVIVNERLQAPRQLRRALRQEIHYIERFGCENHFDRRFSLFGKRVDHLRGIAEYILFLNPDDRDARRTVAILQRVRFERRS